MADKEFVDGLIVKAPHEKAPDFVKANISIKVEDLGVWLRAKHKAGEQWVNIDVKVAKSGKWYAEVSNFKPKEGGSTRKVEPKTGHPVADIDSDIPFSPIRKMEAEVR
jgi:hypothetical protein